MNNKTFVRSLLVDSETKRYIRTVSEHSLDKHIELLSKENDNGNNNPVVIVDFSPVIEHLHNEIESAFKKYRNEEVRIHHATTFNNWLRFKDIPSNRESIIYDQAMKIMDDTERTINSIIASLNASKSKYRRDNQKDVILKEIIDDTAIFIESILCHIHAGIIFSPSIIKKSITIPQHLFSVLSLLQDLLREEAGVNPNLSLRHHDNIIQQACMENNIGIDPHVIVNLTNVNISVDDIRLEIYKSPIEDIPNYGNNLMHREWTLTWAKAYNINVQRSSMLIDKIKKIISIIELVDKIKNSDYKFSRDESDIQEVILQLELISDK